ncbi:hypothetical protein [Pseudomonas avellanae]|uniref:hypothetical protein n=1 Tax=Pseudomonas avellanae TaxID=46257 RepID=UPI0018F57E3B|nr:hypothetical protein [Pseudomonas avellanae]
MENSKINQMPAIHDFSLEALLNPARIVHNAAWTRHPWQAIDQTNNFLRRLVLTPTANSKTIVNNESSGRCTHITRAETSENLAVHLRKARQLTEPKH